MTTDNHFIRYLLPLLICGLSGCTSTQTLGLWDGTSATVAKTQSAGGTSSSLFGGPAKASASGKSSVFAATTEARNTVVKESAAPAGTASTANATMHNAVMSALNHSAEVRASESNYAEAGVGISIARQGYFPTLQSSAGSGTNRDYDYSVSLAQPIYDFNQTGSKVNQAKTGQKISIEELRGTREDVALRMAEAYIAVKRYEDLEAAARRSISVYERFVKLADTRSQGGISDTTEVQLANVRLGEARSDYEDVAGLLRAARSSYNSLAGYPASSLAKVPDLSFNLTNNPDIDQLAAEAPGVKLSQAREEEALGAIAVEKASLFPTLAVETYYKKSSEYSNDNAAGIGLRISGPTLTGLSNFKRVDAMQLAAESSRWASEAARRNSLLQVREFTDRAPTLKNQISVLKTQKVQAEKLRQLYEEQFKVGERPFLDLLNVQNDVIRIERSIVNAGYDIYDLQYKAAGALGILQKQLNILEDRS